MLGKLTSVERGPERNVRLIITPSAASSEISEPPGNYNPKAIQHYEIAGLQEDDKSVVTLTFALIDERKVFFYSTQQKFDMALLLDELDANIGERPRIDPRDYTPRRPTGRLSNFYESEEAMVEGMVISNHSTERTRASRVGRLECVSQWRQARPLMLTVM